MENCQPQQSIEPDQLQMDFSAEKNAEVDEKSDEEENLVTLNLSDSIASTLSEGSSLKSKKKKIICPNSNSSKKVFEN